jgi:hypothetical protein
MVALARLLLGLRVVVVTIAMDMVSRAGIRCSSRSARRSCSWQQQAPPPQVVSKAMEATVLILGRAMATTTRRSPQSSMGAPPGLGGASSGLGAPPGLGLSSRTMVLRVRREAHHLLHRPRCSSTSGK